MSLDIAAVGQFAAATKVMESVMEIGLIMSNGFLQLLMTRLAQSFNAKATCDLQ